MIKLIKTIEDFEIHKKDQETGPGHNSHEFKGDEPTPKDFPLIVFSDFWDDPNGPYRHTHHWKSMTEINEELSWN
jgi:hypothetical protein